MSYLSKKFTDENGKMFHTGLGPGDIAETVLMPGDLDRSRIIADCFKESHFVAERRTYFTYTGVTENDNPVSVVSSGMGPLSVSTVAEELKHLGLKTLIRVGTGGAISNNIKPGTICIATGCVRGDGASYEYAPAEFPAYADPYVVRALTLAAREFGEEPRVGLYRAHDSYYRETETAMVDTIDRMLPWVDSGVQMVENESALLFVLCHRLGIRSSSICVAYDSMLEGTPYYAGPPSREVYPDAFEEGYYEKRIELCCKIATRAVDILADLLKDAEA